MPVIEEEIVKPIDPIDPIKPIEVALTLTEKEDLTSYLKKNIIYEVPGVILKTPQSINLIIDRVKEYLEKPAVEIRELLKSDKAVVKTELETKKIALEAELNSINQELLKYE